MFEVDNKIPEQCPHCGKKHGSVEMILMGETAEVRCSVCHRIEARIPLVIEEDDPLARKKLAFKIAEYIDRCMPGFHRMITVNHEETNWDEMKDFDVDEVAECIESIIPQSMADLDAELEAMIPKEGDPVKPSPTKSEYNKLREVLGIEDKNIGITQTIKAAMEEIIKVRASRDEWRNNYNNWITSLGVKPDTKENDNAG
jgi:hypothetical protein